MIFFKLEYTEKTESSEIFSRRFSYGQNRVLRPNLPREGFQLIQRGLLPMISKVITIKKESKICYRVFIFVFFSGLEIINKTIFNYSRLYKNRLGRY